MTLPKVLLWLHGEGICAEFGIFSQNSVSFLCASFWINFISSLLCCTSALTVLVTVVLANTAGFGLQLHLEIMEQKCQESFKSLIFAHGLSSYGRVFWILGASNFALFYSLLKGKVIWNKFTYRNTVYTTDSATMNSYRINRRLRNK